MLTPKLRVNMARYFKVTLDWDGTLTKKDTMFMLGKITTRRDKRLGHQPGHTESWTKFGEAYMEDYDRHKKLYIPAENERRNPESECVWLQSLRGVETRSVKRVEEAGYVKGTTKDDITTAAREAIENGDVALRKDWQRLFIEASAARAGIPLPPNAHIYELEILSVNWSETLIRETLRLSVETLPTIDDIQRRNLLDLVQHLLIQANDIVGLEAAAGSTGALTKPDRLAVHTNLDKLKCYARNLDQIHVYVGDSPNDLDCLLAADVGICIRDEPMSSSQAALAQALDRVNVFVKHVSDHRHVNEREGGVPAEAKLWWAKDFAEVSSFLTRISVQRG